MIPLRNLWILGAVVAFAARAQAPAVVRTPAELGDRKGRFQPGDMAPDFRLKIMHREERVSLASFRGRRPVALVFGSYT